MNEHRDNEELLPWLVNGTLEGEEKARVEAWLAENEEYAALRDFDAAVRDQVQTETAGSPGAFGLRRLQKAIAAEKRAAEPAMPTRAANDSRWWKPAIAAAALVIVVQGGVIFDMFRDQDTYQPLGVATDGITLQVEFEPGATQQQISELLRAIDASIIDGPAASGLYRLQLDPEQSAADEALAALREAGGVVRYAEAE